MSRTIGLTVAFFLTISAVFAAAPIAGPVRLVLRSGATYDVPGAIEIRDGHWVFRDGQGRLLSIDPALVRDVVPAKPRRSVLDAERMRRSSDRTGPGFDGALRYTNADLPPPTAEEETPKPGEDTPAEPPVAEPATPEPAELVAVPRLVGGHDEAWWRKRVAERREEIVDLEKQEHVAHRRLICAQNGMAGGDGCDPLLPAKPNWFASTPFERSLVEQLRESRSRLEERRKTLAEILDEAFELGVPTAWLL